MEEFRVQTEPTDQGGNSPSITLFLGLFLLVLAFFILLVSISTRQDIKSNAVMSSLSSAFTSVLPPSAELTAFMTKEGEIVSGVPFQSQVAKLFNTAIKVVQVETVQPGRLMRVVLRADALFLDDEATVRPGQHALLDRTVAALSGRPPGLHYQMQFVIGSRAVGPTIPVSDTLEMRRAGAFVEEMLGRGAPPDTISIGMRPGDPNEVVLWFTVGFPDEVTLSPLPPLPATPALDVSPTTIPVPPAPVQDPVSGTSPEVQP